MIPKQVADWAKRFVCGNEPETVQRHINLLAKSDKDRAFLTKAIQEVLDGLKPDGLAANASDTGFARMTSTAICADL